MKAVRSPKLAKLTVRVRTTRTGFSIVAIFLLAGQASLFAGQGSPVEPASERPLQKGDVEAGGILGGTLPITLFRARKDRRVSMAAFQVGRVLSGHRGPGPLAGSFEILLEITPLLLLHQPERAFGVTASPLHLRWNFGPMRSLRARAFAEASGGMVFTSQAVPVRTTSFNFIDQAGFGLRFGRNPRRTWLVGYRFQHISNGGRVKPNPGVNFNFVYVGASFHR